MAAAAIREQDIAFYESLYQDIMKDLQQQRSKQRLLVAELLRTKLPTSLLDFLTPEDQKLLRLRENYLTPEERDYVRDIKAELKRLEEGGCLDGTPDEGIFKLKVPGVPVSLCFDIAYIFEQGLVNEDLMLADVNITVDETDEMYRYPLTQEETERLIGEARLLGINPEDYPRMKFSDAEEARRSLLQLKYIR
jgi:hypothetical protein